ncbi:MAG: glycosyltransferase family 4 protein [Tepidisphaerales bacterium]
MRILFLTERFPPDIGGLARSSGRIAASLALLGHEVQVVAWTRQLPPGTAASENLGQGGGMLHRLGLFAATDTTLQHTALFLEDLHARSPLDLVWGHYLHPAGFAAVLFARSRRIPAIVSARGNDVDRLLYPPGDFARLQYTLQNASLVTSVSEDLAGKMRLICDSTPIEVLPNVVDTLVFCPGPASAELRQRLAISAGHSVIGFSGELRYKKGIDFLLRALPVVLQTRPATLLVIGQARAEDQQRLATLSLDHPEIARQIVVTGHIESPADVAGHLRLVDVYVQPSLWDGMPNALLEAMACGLPCIGSSAGGIPEVIEHGRTGSIIPTPQLHRLGEAIVELLAQPVEVRSALGRSARERIVASFSPASEEKMLRRVLSRVSDFGVRRLDAAFPSS